VPQTDAELAGIGFVPLCKGILSVTFVGPKIDLRSLMEEDLCTASTADLSWQYRQPLHRIEGTDNLELVARLRAAR
jgi:hypothetical protein